MKNRGKRRSARGHAGGLGLGAWTLAWLLVGCGESDPGTGAVADTSGGDADEAVDGVTADAEAEVAPEVGGDVLAPDGGDAVTPDADAGESQACVPLEVSGVLLPNDVDGVFTLGGGVDLGLGGPEPDTIVFEFYSDATGTFELGTGDNANYKTCRQCVRILEDIDLAAGKQPRQYFAKAGTLLVEGESTTSRELKVTLSRLEMVEVTIRAADFQSTPVVNGRCYFREAPLTFETAICMPQCGDHRCGDDGCGGSCGEGCEEGTFCSLDGLRCEASASICQIVNVDGVLSNPAAGVYRLSLTPLGLGAVGGSDFLQIEFYRNATGGFSLGAGANRNYATCEQCVRVVVDGRREFFQRSGLLIVDDSSEPIAQPGVDAYVRLRFDAVRLEEITLDEDFNSSPLPGGACIDLVVDGFLSSAEL